MVDTFEMELEEGDESLKKVGDLKNHYVKKGIPVQFQMERVPTEESNQHYDYELTYVMKVNYVQVNNARKITVFCKNLKRVTPEQSEKNHREAREEALKQEQDEEIQASTEDIK